MKQLCLLLLILVSLGARAQSPTWTFVQPISDANGVTDVATDAAGNVYVTGRFTGSLQLGATRLTSSGLCLYVAKLSPVGQVLRVTRLEGATDGLPTALAVDPAGSCYVTGYFQGTLTYNGHQQAPQASPSGYDLFTLKCGPTGTVRWLRQAAGSTGGTLGGSAAQALALDAAGNCYVGGYVSGTEVRFGTLSLGACNNQGFVASYGPQGTLRWARVLAPPVPGDQSRSRVAALATDKAGACYLSGTYYQGWQLDGVAVHSAGSGLFLARLSTAHGQAQWVRTPAGEGDARSLATDCQGNAYFADTFSGTIACGSFQLNSAGSADGYVACYSPQGSITWAQALGGPDYDAPNDLVVDQQQGLIFVSGLMNFTAQGTNQAFLARLDPNGRARQVELVGGPGTSSGGKLALDGQGNVYTTGVFTGSCRFGELPLAASATQSYLGRFGRPATGPGRLSAAADFRLYPNPAREYFLLPLPAAGLTGPATLYDPQGRPVLLPAGLSAAEQALRFDTAALPDGLYVLRLTDGSTPVTRLVRVAH